MTKDSVRGPSNNDKYEDDRLLFKCNICHDTAQNAVVSRCGHLFCWPCLHQWLETRPNRQRCPLCKAAIGKDKVIPLYGCGSTKQDPRNSALPRPFGLTTEHETNGGFPLGFGEGGFHMSFRISAFPFGSISSSINFNEFRPNAQRGTPLYEEEQYISNVFLWVAIIIIFWILLA